MKHKEQLRIIKKNLETARSTINDINSLSYEELKDYTKIVVQAKVQLYPEILRILNESLETLNEVLNENGSYRTKLTKSDFSQK